MGQYHTRQRRGDRVLEMVGSVVEWGPRREGSRMGWEKRSGGSRGRYQKFWRVFEAVLDIHFHWVEKCHLCEMASSRIESLRYQGTTEGRVGGWWSGRELRRL